MKRLLLVAAVSIPTAAFTFGGWAVTTVENVPEYAVAGKPFELTYTVRQHGLGLMTGLAGTVTGTSGSEVKHFGALGIGEGMYRSIITIPKAGEWDLTIQSGFMGTRTALLPLKVIAANAPAPAPMSPVDRGLQLYVAKGCASCHSHQLTKDYNLTKMGPDLSEPKFATPYLTRFLENPAVKTDWKTDQRMPNLGLKPAEITALVAFLNK
jgi:cytochrome c2